MDSLVDYYEEGPKKNPMLKSTVSANTLVQPKPIKSTIVTPKTMKVKQLPKRKLNTGFLHDECDNYADNEQYYDSYDSYDAYDDDDEYYDE
jgi:hypothetical protein